MNKLSKTIVNKINTIVIGLYENSPPPFAIIYWLDILLCPILPRV